MFLDPSDYRFRPVALEQFPLYFFLSGCVAKRQRNRDTLEWAAVTRGTSIERHPSGSVAMSTTFPELPLRDEEMQLLYEYKYYVCLLLQDAWRVPVFHGKLPGPPHADATSEQKGTSALFFVTCDDGRQRNRRRPEPRPLSPEPLEYDPIAGESSCRSLPRCPQP